MASEGARNFDDVRQRRREVTQDGVTVIQEPGRTIYRGENDRVFLRHDETERFRELGGSVRTERRQGEQVTIYDRGGGEEVITVTDESGRLLRRIRRSPDGREVVLIDNGWRGPPRSFEDEVIELPPPPLRIPRERYVVDADIADERLIYETITAPPVAAVPRRYTLDEVRYSPDLRAHMRSVDVNTINFETGSWTVPPDQAQRLATLAQAVNQAVRANPSEVFLLEGHTDAVGSDVDNLSLSDRRAQSVAAILTRDFAVPPENLTTQGYGEQYLKVNTQAPSRENRRVTLRRITPLLSGENAQRQQQ
ncbi:OmpA family protein [Alsobacter sp. KACC 23698]|uniref:OmpA family protein n=1 Tax=Alsobacter sp. KACC 23698 TaxID=3149229 RepID=A0AAU7J9M8_9HYPH